jgi:hypothetical protein
MFPFFRTTLNPWGHAYLLSRILLRSQSERLTPSEYFRNRFEVLSRNLIPMLGEMAVSGSHTPYTHLLPLDRAFLGYLRVTCGIKRVSLSVAACMKTKVDREIDRFSRDLH